MEEVGKIKAAWKWAVAGMLTQLDNEDPEIWNALGDAFVSGHGVERDLEQGENWLRKSTAMFSLVHCYRNCTGTDRNRDEAIRWLDRIMNLSPKDKSDYRIAAKLRKQIDEEFF